MKLDFSHCPYCGNEFDVDTQVYMRGDDYLGCDLCVQETYVDLEEEDEDEESLFWQEQAWDDDKVRGRFGI